MICAIALAHNVEGLYEQKQLALEQGAQILECRLDAMEIIDYDKLHQFIRSSEVPIILSIRSEWNNTRLAPPLQGRKDSLRKLIELKPHYIDLEYPIDMSLIKKVEEPTVPILSMMDFEGMAKIAFNSVLSTIKEFNREVIVKISATPHSIEEVKQLWRWAKILKKEQIQYVVIGMGQLGQLSRIKSKELGNSWTYGRISKTLGEPYIPGMLSLRSLTRASDEEAWHLASLGQLPHNDVLRRIYEELLKAANLNGIFLNLPINTKPEIDQMLLWAEDGLLDGINITSPWQVDILPDLDQKDVSVIQMGSANCVTITKDGLRGYNTQIRGLRRSLEPYGIKRFRRVYIEGTERVARAVITLLKDTAETIVVRDLSMQDDDPIFDAFPEVIPASDSFSEDFDLLVNCSTPDFGFENVLMLRKSLIENSKLIFDPMSKISSPTVLMETAEKMNKQFLGGWEFFFNTALSSFELWTKRSIPPSALKPAIFAEYKDQIDFGFMLNY